MWSHPLAVARSLPAVRSDQNAGRVRGRTRPPQSLLDK
ncbi:MAG: hypothetical protein AVDCRST_MAG27-1025 [uncultured Craurococcus sp.]|uniref:Uncharacterized protein n=1 Tax=uncultured Craurococcus sp. TaxID=1135998 RepID=A0A6J4HS62_9PROT|nr:MAG: hypothetical protein AVDCRST_MAG27-1025 [uncultured Craurococcus sp.]